MHAQDPIPRLPPEKKHWQPFIDRAMAKSPDNRYRNAQQMLSALNLAASKERPSVPSPPPVEAAPNVRASTRAPAPASARQIPVWALIGVPLIALLVIVYFLLRPTPANQTPQSDFFTKQDSQQAAPVVPDTAAVQAPAPAPAPVPAPAPTDVAAAANPDLATPDNPPPVAPAAPADNGATASAFANVTAEVTVTTLDYDPTQPGAHELAMASEQLKQKRLTMPPGDNAMQSLLAAHEAAPKNPDVATLSDKLIAAFAENLSQAVKSGRDDSAKTTYQRAAKFAKDSGRGTSPAWLRLRASLPPLLIARLDKSAASMDYAAVAKAKSLALVLDVAQADLEPSWSRANVVPKLPKPGDLLKGEGPTMVLAIVPSESRSGLAVMREEVTRGDYANFIAISHRAASKCGNALQAIFGSKRNWSDPGIVQTSEHPVVCVSQADARAYASWLSLRTGQRYRLPTQNEWHAIGDYRGGDPCRAGQLNCGNQHGTAPGSGFAPSPLGIQDLHGNVSEWLADSAGGDHYLTAGPSWRNAPSTSPTRTESHNGDRGMDDIGFRLVRDVDLKDVVGQ
jgi:hypothetical protein